MNFIRGTFRVQGDTIDIFPAAYSERAIRVELFGDEIDRLVEVDALTGEVIAERKPRCCLSSISLCNDKREDEYCCRAY